MKDAGPFSSFNEAFTDFMTRVRALVESGTSIQVLESACYMVMKHGEHSSLPLSFYRSRDYGFKLGLIDHEGELRLGANEPTEEQIYRIFLT